MKVFVISTDLCQLENYDLDFIAFMSSLFLLSALEFCKEMTAQNAAGIHPIRVICNSKQMIDVSIFPLRKKETNGKKMAIKVMVYCFNTVFFLCGHKRDACASFGYHTKDSCGSGIITCLFRILVVEFRFALRIQKSKSLM